MNIPEFRLSVYSILKKCSIITSNFFLFSHLPFLDLEERIYIRDLLKSPPTKYSLILNRDTIDRFRVLEIGLEF